MKKIYEKPILVLEKFISDEVMDEEVVKPSDIHVLDYWDIDGNTINFSQGNKLNTINYKEFTK